MEEVRFDGSHFILAPSPHNSHSSAEQLATQSLSVTHRPAVCQSSFFRRFGNHQQSRSRVACYPNSQSVDSVTGDSLKEL
ncbi:hypothetical protein R1flu_022880 [Riccia fluitans]|uniref:Uncharacterized protein n=1 Tax=Riccia fluitans TaxID=41844 RepID=A0ABD1XUI1_9MARC